MRFNAEKTAWGGARGLAGGWEQGELLVGVGEDAVVDLAGGRSGWALEVTHLDVFVAEAEAEHGEQNVVAVGVGVVENQDLGGARNVVIAQRLERTADGLM